MNAGQPIAFPTYGATRHPSPEDLTLFAMQLTAPAETESIAQHVHTCADCRDELGNIFADLALLASTVDLATPSESARQRLVQQVGREKKLVSAGVASAQQAATATIPAPDQGHAPIAAFGRGGAISYIDEEAPQKRNGGKLLMFAGWAVAAGLAVAVALGHKDRSDLSNQLSSQQAELQRLNTDAASSHQLMDALTDPEAVRVTLTTKALPKAQPIGGVTYNPHKGSLVFLASNLDPLQAYKAYELWVIPANGGAPIPAGTFHPDDQGNASLIMPDLPPGVTAKAFGVTIEPNGGSQTPTAPIILSGS